MKSRRVDADLVFRTPDRYEEGAVRRLLERVAWSPSLEPFGTTPAAVATALTRADHVHRWACCAWRNDATPGKQALGLIGFAADDAGRVSNRILAIDPDARPDLDARLRAHLEHVIAARGLRLSG